MVLTDDTKKQIDHWVAKYPADKKRSAVVAALLIAQKQNDGWLSNDIMNDVADYLELKKIEVYEVATFYDMFELKPVGKHKISICTNVSCMLRGADELVACAKKRLNVELGGVTSDGQFMLKETQCLAACANAPMCQIDDEQYHLDLTPEKLIALIDELDQGVA